MTSSPGRPHPGLLWTAAFLLMVGAAVWQRTTGPTYPRRGRSEIAGQDVRWRLLRTSISGAPLLVSIPAPAGVTGTAHYRRYQTGSGAGVNPTPVPWGLPPPNGRGSAPKPPGEPYTAVAMTRYGESLDALLPSQAPAGKLEYYVVLDTPSGPIRIPDGEPVVMRFKGDVPAGVLIPHVVFMFLSMMLGVRAALAALLARPEAARYARVVVVGLTTGGLVLGPLVQKYAFGAYWTGWPFGSDLTDNKTLVMWLAWVAAAIVLGRRTDPADRVARTTAVAAAVVMLAVYVVPHSLRGSQLDYGQLEHGGTAQDAITTGR